MINLNGALAATRRFSRRPASLLLLAAAACIGVGGVGCSTTSSTTNTLIKSFNAYLPPSGTSLVNGDVTLYANSVYLSASVGFGIVGSSGGYISLTSGTYNLYASLPSATQQFAQSLGVTFSGNNTPYTVIAAGEAGKTSPSPYVPQIIVMPDYTSSPLTLSLASNQCAIRVVNVSLNPNPLGLYSTTGGVPSAPIAAGLSAIPFGYGVGSNPYVAVSISSLVNLAIVDSTAPSTVLQLPYNNSGNISNLNTNAFIAGDAYTLIIYGQPGNINAFNALGGTWITDYPLP